MQLTQIFDVVSFVSVPIRGLFNLTIRYYIMIMIYTCLLVSVPIRGLFNLTMTANKVPMFHNILLVSVPIRGLFNLTFLQPFD